MFLRPKDTVLLMGGDGIFHQFDARGEYVASIRPAYESLKTPNGARYDPIGISTGGDLFITQYIMGLGWRRMQAGGTSAGLVWNDSSALIRMSLRDTGSYRFATVSRGVEAGGKDGNRSFELSPEAPFSLNGDELCGGYQEIFNIVCYRIDGSISKIIRRTVPAVPVTAEIKQQVLEWKLSLPTGAPGGRVTADDSARRREWIAQDHFAPTLPAFWTVKMDRLGYLWVKDYALTDHLSDEEADSRVNKSSTNSNWNIFSPTGEWLGTAQLPRRFLVTDIGRDYILGITHDDDGVQDALVFGLDRR